MHDFASTEMATSTRKWYVLTLEKKIEIIKEIEKGKSQRRVAEILQLPKSTVGDTWKDQERSVAMCLVQRTRLSPSSGVLYVDHSFLYWMTRYQCGN